MGRCNNSRKGTKRGEEPGQLFLPCFLAAMYQLVFFFATLDYILHWHFGFSFFVLIDIPLGFRSLMARTPPTNIIPETFLGPSICPYLTFLFLALSSIRISFPLPPFFDFSSRSIFLGQLKGRWIRRQSTRLQTRIKILIRRGVFSLSLFFLHLLHFRLWAYIPPPQQK